MKSHPGIAKYYINNSYCTYEVQYSSKNYMILYQFLHCYKLHNVGSSPDQFKELFNKFHLIKDLCYCFFVQMYDSLNEKLNYSESLFYRCHSNVKNCILAIVCLNCKDKINRDFLTNIISQMNFDKKIVDKKIFNKDTADQVSQSEQENMEEKDKAIRDSLLSKLNNHSFIDKFMDILSKMNDLYNFIFPHPCQVGHQSDNHLYTNLSRTIHPYSEFPNENQTDINLPAACQQGPIDNENNPRNQMSPNLPENNPPSIEPNDSFNQEEWFFPDLFQDEDQDSDQDNFLS